MTILMGFSTDPAPEVKQLSNILVTALDRVTSLENKLSQTTVGPQFGADSSKFDQETSIYKNTKDALIKEGLYVKD